MVRIPEAEGALAAWIGLSFIGGWGDFVGTAGGIPLAWDGAVGAIGGFNVVPAGSAAAFAAWDSGATTGGAAGFAGRAGGMAGGRTGDRGGAVATGVVGFDGAEIVFASITESGGEGGARGGTRFSGDGTGSLEIAGVGGGGSLGGGEGCCMPGGIPGGRTEEGGWTIGRGGDGFMVVLRVSGRGFAKMFGAVMDGRFGTLGAAATLFTVFGKLKGIVVGDSGD